MEQKQIKKVIKINPVSTARKLEELPVKRVCAYCRVSTGSTEQNSSFESQVEYYTRLIGGKDDWVCAGIYADQAQSGTKTAGRGEFQQMLQDCELGKIDLILTKSVTRFARNTIDSIKAIRHLKSCGVEVYFEKERISTFSEKSEQLLTILSSIAQGESESISTNSRWANTYRFQTGTYTISSPAFGYKNNESGELIIQPEEAVIIRRIFDEYLGGKGSYAIAKELREEGVATIRGSKGWQDGVVRQILQNPVYEGDLIFQKTYTTEGVPFIKKHNHGELPQYLITDNHEPIISREEAKVVKQLYEYRRQKHIMEDPSVYQSRYAFSSRIVCGKCGSMFRRKKIYTKREPYEIVQWCCHQHIEDLSKCKQKAIRENSIKQAFINMWNRLASNYQEILSPLLAALKAVSNNPELEHESLKLENQIHELKKQSYMLQKVLLDGNISSALFIEERNHIEMKLDMAYQRLRLLKKQNLCEQEIRQTEFLISTCKNRPHIIEEFDEECFCMIVDKVIAYPNRRLVFRLKNALELEELYGKEM